MIKIKIKFHEPLLAYTLRTKIIIYLFPNDESFLIFGAIVSINTYWSVCVFRGARHADEPAVVSRIKPPGGVLGAHPPPSFLARPDA